MANFQHDCDACQFLGEYESDKKYDLYQTGNGSVLARFGDEGPDYTSMPLSLVPHLPEGHVLREAADRAS